MSNKSIDDIIADIDFEEFVKDAPPVLTFEGFQKKEQKEKRDNLHYTIAAITFVICFFFLVLRFIPLSEVKMAIGVLIGSVAIGAVIYGHFRTKKQFRKELAYSVSDYLEREKRVAIQDLKYMCLGRFLAYPIITLGIASNFIDNDLDGWWLVSAIIFIFVFAALLIYRLEDGIKKQRLKVEDL